MSGDINPNDYKINIPKKKKTKKIIDTKGKKIEPMKLEPLLENANPLMGLEFFSKDESEPDD